MLKRILILLGLAAGEVLFAEVLVTPTGVSKGCGCVHILLFTTNDLLNSLSALSNSLHRKTHRERSVNFRSSSSLAVLSSFAKYGLCTTYPSRRC
jgi:hypothetical protein